MHVGDLVLQIGQFSVESFDSFLDTGLECIECLCLHVLPLLDLEEPLEDTSFFLGVGGVLNHLRLLVAQLFGHSFFLGFVSFLRIHLFIDVLVLLDSFHKLGLLAGKNLAASGDHADEVLSQLEHVVRAALQLLAVVEVLLEIVQRDLLDLLGIFSPLVSQEQVLETVVLTVGSLLDQLVLLAGHLVNHVDSLLLYREKEINRAFRSFDDLWQLKEQGRSAMDILDLREGQPLGFVLRENAHKVRLDEIDIGHERLLLESERIARLEIFFGVKTDVAVVELQVVNPGGAAARVEDQSALAVTRKSKARNLLVPEL